MVLGNPKRLACSVWLVVMLPYALAADDVSGKCAEDGTCTETADMHSEPGEVLMQKKFASTLVNDIRDPDDDDDDDELKAA